MALGRKKLNPLLSVFKRHLWGHHVEVQSAHRWACPPAPLVSCRGHCKNRIPRSSCEDKIPSVVVYLGKYLRVVGVFLFCFVFLNKALQPALRGRAAPWGAAFLCHLLLFCHFKKCGKRSSWHGQSQTLGGSEPFPMWVLDVTCSCCALMSMV